MKWLTDEVLATGGEAVVLRQVLEEIVDVALKRGDRGRSHKAVGLLRAVDAVPQLPGLALDRGGRDLGP